MSHIFFYQDEDLFCHHSLDENPNPQLFPMHAHEMMEIFYFISGKGSYLVEGCEYCLHPGDILIMRATETHKLIISSEEPYERIAVLFSPSILSSVDPAQRLLKPFLNRPLGHMNDYVSKVDLEGKLRAFFDDFNFEGTSNVRFNVVGRLLLFLSGLEEIYENAAADYVPEKGSQAELIAYVNEHLFEEMTLQSVADYFYRSPSQVGRIFRQATGSPFWKYVSIKRLLSARAKIQWGEPAGSACISCGFSDYSTFFRAYRNYFGHPPSDDAP